MIRARIRFGGFADCPLDALVASAAFWVIREVL